MAWRGEPLTVPCPDLADDGVYNRDVAKAVVLACDAPPTTHWQFHISNEQLTTLREFVAEVVRHCPQHRLTLDEATPPPSGPNTRGLLSNARARAELGYQPDYPGVSGVADYVTWLARHQTIASA
jgi:UDP-glucose 4-epimerase